MLHSYVCRKFHVKQDFARPAAGGMAQHHSLGATLGMARRATPLALDPGNEPHPYAHLRAWRERAALTQANVAVRMETSEATINRWERGKQALAVEKYIALSAVYGAESPGDLMLAPAVADVAAALRRAHGALRSMTPEQRERWLAMGEDVAGAGPKPD